MSESLYGSVSGTPIWTGIPSAGVGFPQAPFPLGSLPIGVGVPGFASPQIPTGGFPTAIPMDVPAPTYGFTPQGYGFSGGVIGQPPTVGFAPLTPTPGSGVPLGPGPYGTLGGFPAFIGPDVPLGFTIPQLVAAVAMRRHQPMGPTNDQEIEDFIFDALELLPGTSEVEVRCEGGRVTLTGSVPHKRLKRDTGEIAWMIPGTTDVQNNVTIATRRRGRGAPRDAESQSAAGGRKQA
jgi:BON domain-containing protein